MGEYGEAARKPGARGPRENAVEPEAIRRGRACHAAALAEAEASNGETPHFLGKIKYDLTRRGEYGVSRTEAPERKASKKYPKPRQSRVSRLKRRRRQLKKI